LSRSSRGINVEVNVKGKRKTSIVDGTIEEDFEDFSLVGIRDSETIKVDHLDPSVGLVSLDVSDVELSSSSKSESRRGVIESKGWVLGNIQRTLEINEDVKRSLETTSDSLDSDVVTTGSGETIRNLPVAFRTRSKTRSANLSNLASSILGRRLFISPKDGESSFLDVGDLDNDLVSLIIVVLIDIDTEVNVALVGNKLEGLSVLIEAIADNVGTREGGDNVIDLNGVSDGSLIKRRIRSEVGETDNRKVVSSISELARRDDNLAPVVGEIVSRSRVRRSASLDVIVARTVSSKVIKVVKDLDGTMLDVVNKKSDVISNLGVLDEERVVLDLTGLDVRSVWLISSKRSDGVLEGGSESKLNGNIVELVLGSENRDVITTSSEFAGLDLPEARRFSFADVLVEVLKALSVSSTSVLVEESGDAILVGIGVKVNQKIDSSEILRDVNEKVLVTVIRGTSINRDSRNELSVCNFADSEFKSKATIVDGAEISLDGNKVIIISPLASGDGNGFITLRKNVGNALVVPAALSSNSSTVHKDLKSVTNVIVLSEEVTVLKISELEDKVVVGDGLGTNLVMSVLVGGVPLSDLISDGLSRNERLDDRGLVDGGSESVSDGSGVSDKVLIDSENRDVPDSTAEITSGNKDGAESADLVDFGEEVGDGVRNVVSTGRGSGSSAVVKVIIARAVSSKEVVVDKGLKGLGDTVLDVGDLNGKIRTLDNTVGTNVIVVVLTLKDVLSVRDGALDGEGNIKINVESVVDRDLVKGGVSISIITDVMTINREVKRTLLEFTGLDHEGAGLTGVGTDDVILRRSGIDLEVAGISSHTIEIRTGIAFASRKRTMEH